MGIDLPPVVASVPETLPREDVYIPKAVEWIQHLLQHELLVSTDPLPLTNRTSLRDIVSTTVETTTNYYAVKIEGKQGTITLGLFSKTDVDAGKVASWSFYYGGKSYLLTLARDTQTNTLTGILDTAASVDSATVDQTQTLDIASLPQEITPSHKESGSTIPLTSLSGLEHIKLSTVQFVFEKGALRWYDRTTGVLIGEITPDMYASYIDVVRSVYTHPTPVTDGTTGYTLALQFFGNQQGKAMVELVRSPIFSVDPHVQFDEKKLPHLAGVQATLLPHADWKKNMISLEQEGKQLGAIDFGSLSDAQQQQLATWSLTEKNNLPLQGVVFLENKPFRFTLTNTQGIIHVSLYAYESGTTEVLGLYPTVAKTRRTIGTWVGHTEYDRQGNVLHGSVLLVGSEGVWCRLDESVLKKVGTPGQTTMLTQKLQNGITYTLTLKNVNDQLQVTIDQLDGFRTGGVDDLIKKDNEPLPVKKPLEEKTEKEKQKEEEKKNKEKEEVVAEESDEPDDYEPSDDEIKRPPVPSRIEEINPWVYDSPSTENMKNKPFEVGGVMIKGFYEYPKPFMGAKQEDLKNFYFDHEGGGIFTLMYNIPGPFNDDQREKNALFLKKHPEYLDGRTFTVQDDDAGVWYVKLYVSKQGLLGFYLRPPFTETNNELYEIGSVLGTPPRLQMPTDDPGSYIYSGMDAGGQKSKTNPRRGHFGIDIPGTKNTTVTAPVTGEIVYIHNKEKNHSNDDFVARKNKNGAVYYRAEGSRGNYIILKTANNCYVRLSHLSPEGFRVRTGDIVFAGQPLANMGRSGRIITSDPKRNNNNGGVHLHVEYFRLHDQYLHSSDYSSIFAPGRVKPHIKQWFDPEKYMQKNGGTGRTSSVETEHEFYVGWKKEGKASHYDDSFEGKTTASGETFKQSSNIAAHNSLPFGTIVRVTNKKNGKYTNVVIEDTGSFGEKYQREIDLSKSSAEKIDMVGAGTADVVLEIVKVGDRPNTKKEFSGGAAVAPSPQKTTSPPPEKNPSTLSSSEYLTNKPTSLVKSSFTRQGQSFQSYRPLLQQTIGKEAGKAPWGWLVKVNLGIPYLITPQGDFPLTEKTIRIGPNTYKISVTQETTNKGFPQTACFVLK